MWSVGLRLQRSESNCFNQGLLLFYIASKRNTLQCLFIENDPLTSPRSCSSSANRTSFLNIPLTIASNRLFVQPFSKSNGFALLLVYEDVPRHTNIIYAAVDIKTSDWSWHNVTDSLWAAIREARPEVIVIQACIPFQDFEPAMHCFVKSSDVDGPYGPWTVLYLSYRIDSRGDVKFEYLSFLTYCIDLKLIRFRGQHFLPQRRQYPGCKFPRSRQRKNSVCKRNDAAVLWCNAITQSTFSVPKLWQYAQSKRVATLSLSPAE